MNATLIHNTAPTHWLTTSQVARRIGCHRNTARHMAEAGAFPNAIKLRSAWRIPVGDVARYIERKQAGQGGGA